VLSSGWTSGGTPSDVGSQESSPRTAYSITVPAGPPRSRSCPRTFANVRRCARVSDHCVPATGIGRVGKPALRCQASSRVALPPGPGPRQASRVMGRQVILGQGTCLDDRRSGSEPTKLRPKRAHPRKGEHAVLESDVDILRLDAGQLCPDDDLLAVLVDIARGRPAHRLTGAEQLALVAVDAVHLLLHSCELAEGVPTGQHCEACKRRVVDQDQLGVAQNRRFVRETRAHWGATRTKVMALVVAAGQY